MNAEFRSTAVVIPAFNAANTLPRLLGQLESTFDKGNLIVVNDGSTDSTGEVLRPWNGLVLTHSANRGKGAALETGFELVRRRPQFKFVVTMDADLQHRAEDLPALAKRQQETGCDVVIGKRNRLQGGMPLARIASNTLTSALVSARTRRRIEDSQCGFRLIRRSVIERIRLESTGYEAETEFIIKAAKNGFSFAFAPIQTVYAGERSYMTHWQTTRRFLQVLLKEY